MPVPTKFEPVIRAPRAGELEASRAAEQAQEETQGLSPPDISPSDLFPGAGKATQALMHGATAFPAVTFLSRKFRGPARVAISEIGGASRAAARKSGIPTQKGSEDLGALFAGALRLPEQKPITNISHFSQLEHLAGQKQVREATQAALLVRQLPEEFLVYRGGPVGVGLGAAVPVTLDRTVALEFAEGDPKQVRSFLVKRSDVLADLLGLLGPRSFAKEQELLVAAKNLRPLDITDPAKLAELQNISLRGARQGALFLMKPQKAPSSLPFP